MKIIAIIEKGTDGMYSAYSEEHISKSYFGGFGNNANEAREDFLESVREAIAETLERGESAPSMEDIEIEFHYDIPSLFSVLDFINVSKFAKLAGINESKMRAYKNGLAYPGEQTLSKISSALSDISRQMESISLV